MAVVQSKPMSAKVMTAALIIVVVLAYLPGLSGGFISDDHNLIQERGPLLQSSFGFKSLVTHSFWWGTQRESGRDLYRPWASATYWIDHQIGGTSPQWYHVTNLAVHAANTVLLLILLTSWLGFEMGFLVTALTALCPIALTSVGWIAGRTDLWAMFFSLLFLIAFRAARKSGRALAMVGAAVAYFLALASKEIAVVAPVLAWLIDYVSAQKQTKAIVSAPKTRSGIAYATMLVPLAAYLFLRHDALQRGAPRGVDLSSFLTSLPYLPERILRTAFHAIVPVRYNFFSEFLWSRPGDRGVAFVLLWLVFLAALTLIAAGLRRKQLWAVGGVWFGLIITPVYAFGQSFSPIADFYAYMALPGLWIFVVDGLRSLTARYGVSEANYRPLERYGGFALALLFGLLTFVRLPILNSDFSLMSHTVATQPRSGIALLKLSEIYEERGDLSQTEDLLSRAVQVDPTAIEPQLRLSRFYLNHGAVQQASPHVDALAQYGATDAEAQAIVARFYYEAGHCEEAVTTFQRALGLAEPSDDALFDYGLALLCVHRDKDALAVYQEVVRRKPASAQAYNNLGICHENLAQLDEARAAYMEAVRLDPKMAMGWESLALVSVRQGRMEEARQAAAHYATLNPPRERLERLQAALDQPNAGGETP